MGSSADAYRSRLPRQLGELGDAAPQIGITHLEEALSFPYRYIEDPLTISQVGRLSRYAQTLAEDALKKSRLDGAARKHTGVFVGSSSFNVGQEESRLALSSAGDPAIVFETVGQGKFSRSLKRHFDLGGPDYAYSTACTSSANALLAAHQMLSRGVIDHALVLGLELFNETTLLGFHNLGLLASKSLLPFDDRREGMVLGEAGTAVVLSRESQKDCLQLCGGATCTDNQNLTSANVDGSTIASALKAALDNTRISEQDILAIKTHGTGSPMSDEAEARGLRRVFDVLPPLVALKPAIGHTLGASGAAEFALWSYCLDEGLLPANTGIAVGETQSGVSLNQQSEVIGDGFHLLNYFAFGGNNTVLVTYRQ
jgi:3-oxoacyl-[acyl-carrier-protein] synthase-1